MVVRKPGMFTRRRIIIAGVSLPIPLFLVGCSGGDGDSSPATTTAGDDGEASAATATRSGTQSTSPTSQAAATLAPTPTCADDDDPTPAQTEGPFFTPNSPERTVLFEPGMGGTKLLLTGSVVSTACTPLAGTLIDFWQCDDAGVYDTSGNRLRGHQFTNASGSFRLESVVPALYPGRTRHIHVKVQAPNRPVLTTQLYFPGEARNRQDRIYREECEIADYRDGSGGKQGTFQFVLEV